MYLIKDSLHRIVGRVNLVSVVRGAHNKAELGFRVGKEYNGKGYATEAVRLILAEAAEKHYLHRVEAGTAPENIGSQIVLIKNGFLYTGRSAEHMFFQGKWSDSLNYEKTLDSI